MIELLRDANIYTGLKKDHSWLSEGQVIAVRKGVEIAPYTAFLGCTIFCEMKSHSFTNSEFSQFQLRTGLKFGRYCSIGSGFKTPFPRHPLEAVSTSSVFYDQDFDIGRQAMIDQGNEAPIDGQNPQKPAPIFGNDVWLGNNCSVNPGLVIGDGASIAAEAVVTKDVPPYAIVGGNPARLIRFRFETDIIDALLELKWWDYRLSDIRRIGPANPVSFIDRFRREVGSLERFDPQGLDLWSAFEALGES